ncbi:MAG: hypothetical protein WBP61_08370 [Nocardioides sp.]
MLALVGTGLTLGLLAACSSEPTDPDPAASDHAASEAAGVGWSPCDGLAAQDVRAVAGEPMDQRTGTEDAPRCTFVPRSEGGPAYDVSYLFFDGGLDTALDAMGTVGAQLEPVDVPGAAAARIAVRERKSGILVTGFVQTDGLVQSVNAVKLRPYDRDELVAGTTDLLALLADRAPVA